MDRVRVRVRVSAPLEECHRWRYGDPNNDDSLAKITLTNVTRTMTTYPYP